MDDFSTLTLSRVLSGIVSLNLSEPLRKIRHKIRQEWGDFEATGADDLELGDYLAALISTKYPKRAWGKLYHICEKAFGDEYARRHSVQLKVWALMQDDSINQGLPFPEDACLTFIYSFFEIHMDAKDVQKIGPAALAVLREVRQDNVPERWHLTYVRNRMMAHVGLKEFERKFSSLCKACRTHGARNEETYRLFQEYIVRKALQVAAGSIPPSGAQSGASA